ASERPAFQSGAGLNPGAKARFAPEKCNFAPVKGHFPSVKGKFLREKEDFPCVKQCSTRVRSECDHVKCKFCQEKLNFPCAKGASPLKKASSLAARPVSPRTKRASPAKTVSSTRK